MKRVEFERYQQRIKMTLGRDLNVLGILNVGQVLQLTSDRMDVRELDILIAGRGNGAVSYIDDPTWLPDGDSILLTASFGPNRRDILFSDGRIVRLLVHPSDELPARIGSVRVLLDRGGIARTVRERSSVRNEVRVPDVPDDPTPDHAVVLTWEAYLRLQWRDRSGAERLARVAIDTASMILREDRNGRDHVLRLEREAIDVQLRGLAGILAERFPAATGTDVLQTWLGAPTRTGASGEPGTADPAPRDEPVTVEVEWPDELVARTPDGMDAVVAAEPEEEKVIIGATADRRHRETVLARDACPFCGGALAPPGRLYVKGTLKDIRFLPGLSGSLDLKHKVVARPCHDCGQISIRFQDDN